MALRNGLDTVGIASFGAYTETYGSSNPGNIANIYASRGLLEDAPNVTLTIAKLVMHYLFRRTNG